MEHRPSVRALVTALHELESAAQSVAFGILRDDRDYELSDRLLGVARDLNAIGRRLDSFSSVGERTIAREEIAPSGAKTRGRGGFPRFEVEEDRIVKIGKGKSKRAKEYRHEAPRESFEKLAGWIENTHASGKREWAAQDAIEALQGEVPSYQVYVVVAALHAGGIFRMVRKGWYEASDKSVTPSEYWNMLRRALGTNGARGKQ